MKLLLNNKYFEDEIFKKIKSDYCNGWCVISYFWGDTKRFIVINVCFFHEIISTRVWTIRTYVNLDAVEWICNLFTVMWVGKTGIFFEDPMPNSIKKVKNDQGDFRLSSDIHILAVAHVHSHILRLTPTYAHWTHTTCTHTSSQKSSRSSLCP